MAERIKEELDVEKVEKILNDHLEIAGKFCLLQPCKIRQDIATGRCYGCKIGSSIVKAYKSAPSKITEEELRGALPKQKDYLYLHKYECHCPECNGVRNYNQAIDDCFNSISALLKKKGVLA